MEHVDPQDAAQGLPTAGSQLRAAREAQGRSRADIASQTKIAERHLAAIEEDRLGDLAARTYAVGFARAYARAVGLDEQAIAARIRQQLDHDSSTRVEYAPSFEPGDPARVPPRGLAWIAALGVVAVVVALLLFWSNYLSPEGDLPDLTAERTAGPVAPAARPSAAAPAPTSGPVVLTAVADKVWVKVTDAQGGQVLQKELAKGEAWTAPADGKGLALRTGRPDVLQISVGGKVLPPLSTEPKLVSGVSLAATDLLARANGTVQAPSAAVNAQATGAAPVGAPSVSPAPRPASSAAGRRPAPRSQPTQPQETAAVPTPESILPPASQ